MNFMNYVGTKHLIKKLKNRLRRILNNYIKRQNEKSSLRDCQIFQKSYPTFYIFGID